MMNLCRTLWFSCALLLLLPAIGCTDAEVDSCPAIAGVFVPVYRYLAGSCSPSDLPGYEFALAPEDRGNITRVQMRLADSVTTKILSKGCTIVLQQAVETKDGRTTLEVEGELGVENAYELSGMVTRTEFDEQGALRCHGVYEAQYSRTDVLVGGALQRANRTP